MKIIDCFTFYNEIDLLYYRLATLYDIVDYFIIVESTHTHVGKEKEMFFEKNKELFTQFQNKIINVVVDDFPCKYPNIDISKSEQWINEKYQRNQIARGFQYIDLNDEDVIIITDLDEIPDRNVLQKIKNNEIHVDINILEMDFYYCNLNHKKNSKWYYARIISYAIYKKIPLPLHDIRYCHDIRVNSFRRIENAGWHLSYFGDSRFIKNKIENFGHQEFNNEHFTDIDKIDERVKNFCDIFDRNDHENRVIKISVKDNNRLPHEYEKYLQKFVIF